MHREKCLGFTASWLDPATHKGPFLCHVGRGFHLAAGTVGFGARLNTTGNAEMM